VRESRPPGFVRGALSNECPYRDHAGEFLKLLYALAPDEEALYAKGAGEVTGIAKSQLHQTI